MEAKVGSLCTFMCVEELSRQETAGMKLASYIYNFPFFEVLLNVKGTFFFFTVHTVCYDMHSFRDSDELTVSSHAPFPRSASLVSLRVYDPLTSHWGIE